MRAINLLVLTSPVFPYKPACIFPASCYLTFSSSTISSQTTLFEQLNGLLQGSVRPLLASLVLMFMSQTFKRRNVTRQK